MTTQIVQVFDPAMCCSIGVCGPDVDPKLVAFTADMEWLKSQGVAVQRYSLSQSPAAFVENELVRTTLIDKSEKALPLMVVNGKVVVVGRYPDRQELVGLLKLKASKASASKKSGDCCCGHSC